jgi:hypothetical protein
LPKTKKENRITRHQVKNSNPLKLFIHQRFRGSLIADFFSLLWDVIAGRKKFSIVGGDFCLETPPKKFLPRGSFQSMKKVKTAYCPL